MLQGEDALLVVVDDAAGGADQDVDAGLDVAPLLFVARAAERERDDEIRVPAQHLGVFCDLYGELARGCENEAPRLLFPALDRRPLQETFVHRDQERGGLAGPGLGLAGHVPAVECDGQGGGLDRGAVFESGVADARADGLGKAQRVEPEFAEMFSGHSKSVGKCAI